MRIGHGYDAHAFAQDRKLVLGGVTIPHDRGLAAHSDGDVLIHALCDALLGAAGLGDIGRHFPDTSAQYHNIDSRILLRNVVTLIRHKKLTISNIDITVLAQAPKLAPHIEAMQTNLSEDAGITMDRINIKATTTEGMGFIGRQEGIAAYVVVLLEEG
ncbi:MAG: 2-C-methyl-D-erythritol 2,4-cyclodiphosphate synthase [Gammaproteobacteria bacterium]